MRVGESVCRPCMRLRWPATSAPSSCSRRESAPSFSSAADSPACSLFCCSLLGSHAVLRAIRTGPGRARCETPACAPGRTFRETNLREYACYSRYHCFSRAWRLWGHPRRNGQGDRSFRIGYERGGGHLHRRIRGVGNHDTSTNGELEFISWDARPVHLEWVLGGPTSGGQLDLRHHHDESSVGGVYESRHVYFQSVRQ